MSQIHITNGDAFNRWFKKETGLNSIAFQEAMISHLVNGKPFDETFIACRASGHQVSIDEYLDKMKPFLDAMNHLSKDDELVLWFGVDSFCQMNLLTIFEYLIQKDCQAAVKTVLFDENQPWEISLKCKPKEIILHDYRGLYESVLVSHQCAVCHDEIMNQGIQLYLDLCSDQGRVMTLIQKSLDLNDEALVELLMNETKNEGLSDIQALEMIKETRRMNMKRALFVIDYQNDFVDGALGFAGAELLDEKIAEKVRTYGTGNVWFTRDTHFDNYLETREGKNLPVVHCIKQSKGWEVYGETAKALEEVQAKGIDKLVFGMDVTDPLTASVLPEEVDEIELVGLVSNICVVSNAVVLQSKYPEASIIVDASCTDSFDHDLHEKVLDVLEGLQVKVINRK